MPLVNPSIAEDDQYLPQIDGLRGIAILMVLGIHTLDHTRGFVLHFPTPVEFVLAGKYGVQLFFILSAFTLFASCRARQGRERKPWRNFFIRRAFRILPLWWVAILLYAWKNGAALDSICASLFMYFWFYGDRIFNVQWSIFVEEGFYLCFPFFFRRIQGLFSALVFLALSCIVTWVWLRYFPPVLVALRLPAAEFFPIAHFPTFAAGIVLHFALSPGALLVRLGRNPWFRAGFEAITMFLLYHLPSGGPGYATFAFSFLVTASFFPGGGFARLARSRWLGRFGVACYSIYLFHILWLAFLGPARIAIFDYLGLSGWALPWQFAIWFPPFAVITLAYGTFTFRYVEKPCVRLGKRLIAFLEEARVSRPLTA